MSHPWCYSISDTPHKSNNNEDKLFISVSVEGIDNAVFYCGKAEDVLPGLMKRLWGSDVVAIVDPPRDGLRKCKSYVPSFQQHLNIYAINLRTADL